MTEEVGFVEDDAPAPEAAAPEPPAPDPVAEDAPPAEPVSEPPGAPDPDWLVELRRNGAPLLVAAFEDILSRLGG